MNAIYKYPLGERFAAEVEMPKGAQILHVGTQDGHQPTVWAAVDLNAAPEVRHFRLLPTGGQVPGSPERALNEGEHLGTVFLGPLVCHVFEVDRPT